MIDTGDTRAMRQRVFELASNLNAVRHEARRPLRLHPRDPCSFQFYNFRPSFSLSLRWLTGHRNWHRDRRSFIRRKNHAVGTAEEIGSPDGFSERARKGTPIISYPRILFTGRGRDADADDGR